MSHESQPLYSSDQARDEALRADQELAERPLPYSGVRHYPHETARQVDLAAAERSNVAKAAADKGMTSDEYLRARREAAKEGKSFY